MGNFVEKKLEILFEDNHLLVVNKPAVLATMGAASGEPSLLSHCKSYLKTKYSKPGNVYLGVVSRLDAFVTGVIVFARTSKAAARLTKQFQQGETEKTYWAIVSGEQPQSTCVLEDWVLKNDQRRRMETVRPTTAGAKKALLSYQLLDTLDSGLRLLEIELETGRKHQIRVQLSSRGMPIVGDRKYDSSMPFPNGIALHAKRLSFNHPTSKSRITFNCQPPKYWKMQRFSI
jgi:23S rRNA pseudouridine1911/1915/1917 synthase